MGKQVPKTNTPVPDAQMAAAIMSVWQRMFGTPPTKEQVYMIMAQTAIETGAGRSAMHNYNIGNIIAGTSGHDYFLGGDWMYEDKAETKKKKIVQRFRAYNSLEEGVTDYLNLLSKSKRYASSWQHILHPDVRAYSKALRQAGYYGAKEEDYTKGLLAHVNKLNKGDSYNTALSGKVQPSSGAQPSMVAQKTPQQSPQQAPPGLENMLEQILRAASLKSVYKKALPTHDILIQIAAPDYTSAIEFSRVLCTALDEDLLSTSYPHTDGSLVEVECSISGPAKECFDAVKQMAEAVAETFKDATVKIGAIDIKTNCIMDKKSYYQPISPRTADTNYRKFLLKFI